MSILVSNLDQEEAWGVTNVLPPGWHQCKITDAQEGQSTGGHPQIELDLEATAGDSQGGTIKDWIVVIPKTYGKVKQLLLAAQVPVPSGQAQLDVASLKGRQVQVLVRTEQKRDDPGATINRVAGYNLAAEPSGTATTGDANIPFRRLPIPQFEERRRDLFTGDRWAA